MYQIILLQCIFALGVPLNKALLSYCSFLTLTIIRLLFAGSIVLILHLFFSKDKTIYKGQPLLLMKKIFFGSFLKYTLKYWGFQFISTSHMAFLLHTTPLWTGFFDYIFYQTPLSYYNIAGIFLGFVGSLPLLITGYHDAYSISLISLPSIAIMIAVACHSYGILCTKELIIKHSYSPFLVTAIGSLGAGILALIFALIIDHRFYITDGQNFSMLFLALVVINNIIGKSWHTMLLKRYNATFLACSDYLYPCLITIGTYIATGKFPDIKQLIAFGISIIGLSLFRVSISNQK